MARVVRVFNGGARAADNLGVIVLGMSGAPAHFRRVLSFPEPVDCSAENGEIVGNLDSQKMVDATLLLAIVDGKPEAEIERLKAEKQELEKYGLVMRALVANKLVEDMTEKLITIANQFHVIKSEISRVGDGSQLGNTRQIADRAEQAFQWVEKLRETLKSEQGTVRSLYERLFNGEMTGASSASEMGAGGAGGQAASSVSKQVVIDLSDGAQTGAGGAGPARREGGEGARRRKGNVSFGEDELWEFDPDSQASDRPSKRRP